MLISSRCHEDPLLSFPITSILSHQAEQTLSTEFFTGVSLSLHPQEDSLLLGLWPGAKLCIWIIRLLRRLVFLLIRAVDHDLEKNLHTPHLFQSDHATALETCLR